MMIYIESPYSLICYTLHQCLKTISDTPLNCVESLELSKIS